MSLGAPFDVHTNLLLKNWLLSSVLSSRVGGYCTEYRFWVGWLLEDNAEFLGEKFPDISSERLRVYRDRSPALVLWKSRLGYVYWDRFSNVLIFPGAPFEVRTNLLLKNWLLSCFLSSRVGEYCTEYRFWVGWLPEDHLGRNWLLSDLLLSCVGGYCQ